jgi:very-short-patch-repair endonuclease
VTLAVLRATLRVMREPFVGSEAIAEGTLTKSRLCSRYTRIFRDVYVDPSVEVTAALRAKAGWLWAKRQGIVAGFSAAALHGSRWVDDIVTVELIYDNRHRLPGIQTRGNCIGEDEIGTIAGVPVTTPARTALDLGCWYPVMTAVAAIDLLARATDIKAADIEWLAHRYPGRRGIVRARQAAGLFDAGAQSPKESWLRVVLMQAGLPRPQTQIPVRDEFGEVIAYLDMGWKDLKVAVEYDGEQHRTDRRQYIRDIRRLEILERRGWIIIRVVAGDRPDDIVRRVRAALARRL